MTEIYSKVLLYKKGGAWVRPNMTQDVDMGGSSFTIVAGLDGAGAQNPWRMVDSSTSTYGQVMNNSCLWIYNPTPLKIIKLTIVTNQSSRLNFKNILYSTGPKQASYKSTPRVNSFNCSTITYTRNNISTSTIFTLQNSNYYNYYILYLVTGLSTNTTTANIYDIQIEAEEQ